MTDLTHRVLPGLTAHRLPGLDLGDDFLSPNYHGYSILNLPATVCNLLGVPVSSGEPLATEFIEQLGSGYRRIILVLVDALSLFRMQRWMADGTASVWSTLAQKGIFAPLTSITPSTTSAALTTLWTGRSPAEHGIAGYELWLREYGVVSNMILHSPTTFQNDVGGLTRAGFNPEVFLPVPTLGPHLAAHRVKTLAFQHFSIAHSGLSRMFFKDVAVRAFGASSDLWINLRQQLESQTAERLYAYVYWGEVDSFSHRYGPDDERTVAEFASFNRAFERLFLERLSPAARRDTLFILTADHGQITTCPDPHYELRNHPSLVRCLHIQPTGENRLAYLYVRPGQVEAVQEYVERTWPGQFSLVESAFAIKAGLFGPGMPDPRLYERLGDWLLLAHGQAYLWWSEKDNHLLGRHGGLSPDEMLVPFLACSLD